MEATLLVAKIFGVYLVVAGLFLLIKGKTVPSLLRDFFDHPAMSYLTGIILITLSATYLLQYNIWTGFWQTVVTIFVWLVFIKGILYIFAPKVLSRMVKNFTGAFRVYGVIAVIIGVYFYFGI
jgi:uncharacterized protein YjeT (DUF2065 family)